jgi:hypothetical protein
MKFNHTDTLQITWGDEIKTARPANGWDGVTTDSERIKVILDGDTSHNPVTITIDKILSVNEVQIKEKVNEK